MRIDIWSDIACPFCYIGKRHLEAALQAWDAAEETEIVWHSFELDPRAIRESEDISLETRLSQKYGMNVAQVEAMIARVTGMGAEAGLDLQLRKARPVNTFDAHRLLHLAADRGCQNAAKERLLKAHLVEGADLGDPLVLVALLQEVGLKESEVQAVLVGERYAMDVRRDESQARAMGCQGVPFFVFNQHLALSGAQPVAVFLQALHQARAQDSDDPVEREANAESCSDEHCAI